MTRLVSLSRMAQERGQARLILKSPSVQADDTWAARIIAQIIDRIADKIINRGASTADADAILIIIAQLHDIGEHQLSRAAAADIIGTVPLSADVEFN